MNIKIKADNVHALFDKSSKIGYDQMYAFLKDNINEEFFIFSKRTPGSGYLQWDLPGEGWTALSEADPLFYDEVIKEKERCYHYILDFFGKQQLLANKVLTVPDESYIFFRPATNGNIELKITAWGYKNPEKIGGEGLKIKIPHKEKLQEVSICFVYDNRSLPEYKFRINGFIRMTGSDGVKVLGSLPIGSSYNIETGSGRNVTLTVVEGQMNYPIDVTDYVAVSVVVKKDGEPVPNMKCELSYWGHSVSLTTDENGQAKTTLPLDLSGGDCSIRVEDECQRRPLMMPVTIFEFDFKTPVPPIKPEPPVVPGPLVKHEPFENPEPPVNLRRFCPIVRIEGKEGFIGRRYPVRITIGNVAQDYVSDDAGEVHLLEHEENQAMRVDDLLIIGNSEAYSLSADQLVYIFHVPYRPTSSSADIKIIVEDENGQRMKNATIFFEQKDHPDTLGYLDNEGTFYLGFGDYATGAPLNVVLTVNGEKWNPIVFDLVEGETEYLLRAVRKVGLGKKLLAILASLALLLLTIFVYLYILDILFD